MIATTRPLTNRSLTTRPLVSTVFLHDVAARRTTGWPAEPAGGRDVARDAARRPAEDRRRSAAPAPVPAPTRSPEDEVEEYERWDGMA